MKNLKKFSYLFVCSALVAACSGEKAATPAAPAPARAVLLTPPGKTVAVVNGEAVTEPMLAVFASGRGLDVADPAARQRALDALVENVMLAQDAHARGLGARPDVQAEVALVGVQQLAGRNLAELRRELVPTDDQVRAYYDQEAARTGGIELNLQHILFATEAEARAALQRAQAPGADFAALMGEYGAGSAKQARDLGWANLTQLPDELGAAAQTTADGTTGSAPVQTKFGWHVYRRVASRPFAPPPFEQVREGARKQYTDQLLAERVAALREKAKIEMQAPATSAN
jgi:peptidyl-prolyl cis-trans isomerase C